MYHNLLHLQEVVAARCLSILSFQDTRRLIQLLITVYGGLRPTMAVSDVELVGSNLLETQSIWSSVASMPQLCATLC
jgi:hypothetical protein